ncbi:hypothetical protein ACD661_04855 [Legionella lytica]|uniref:Transmembrane protein n=1 Tax=Legionella lytica TaxID=96232 RepID=A0ABW8D5C0_9GAMM
MQEKQESTPLKKSFKPGVLTGIGIGTGGAMGGIASLLLTASYRNRDILPVWGIIALAGSAAGLASDYAKYQVFGFFGTNKSDLLTSEQAKSKLNPKNNQR